MIGQLVARGGYTLKEVYEMSVEERYFIHYHQNLVEKNNIKTLQKTLGVLWDKLDFIDQPKAEASESISKEVFIPLAMTINPNIHKVVSDMTKASLSHKGIRYDGSGNPLEKELGEVRSLGELSKEEFYRKIGQPMPSKVMPKPSKR